MLGNEFYQSSDQFNTTLYEDKARNDLFDEWYRSIESTMELDNSSEYYQTSQPIVGCKTDLLRQDHPVLTASQANETEFKTPVEMLTDEHRRIYNNYDTCFGVVSNP